jgi:hypothetical protein
MMHDDRIGLDIGPVAHAGERASAAASVGARLVRVRIALAGRTFLDAAFLDSVRASVAALRAQGLAVLAVVDSDLTVAPEGAGAFADRPLDMLARAWVEEMLANTTALAAAIGQEVDWWEVLPRPNLGAPARIAPARWADLAMKVAQAIRKAAPEARVISGGLISDEQDDGVDYLRAVFRAADATHLWPIGSAPFEAIGLELGILPDGGAAEDYVGAAVRERVQRLWRVMEQAEGTAAAAARGLFITGVGWDATRAGEAVQARNLWTALDTLTTDGVVHGVVWSGLVDGPDDHVGLYRADTLDGASRRPAWQAFSDFVRYLQQISPAPAAGWLGEAALDEAPAPADSEPEVHPAPAIGLAAVALAAEPEVFPEPVPPEGADAVDSPSHLPAIITAAAALAAEPEGQDKPVSEPEPVIIPGTTAAEVPTQYITIRVPSAEELLRAQGLAGAALTAALAALTAEFGDLTRLAPGEYRIAPSADLAPPASAPAACSNQQVISALYRAAGGNWALFERSGLVLSELAARRNEPYAGPAIDTLTDLTPDERRAVSAELDRILGRA